MFIDNINHQNINTKINLLDLNTKVQKTEKDKFIDYVKIELQKKGKDKFINDMKMMDKTLGKISKIQNRAIVDSEKFILNQSGTSLNDVMINLEKSSISMQMAIQIRNKVISAYQEIMSQQI